MLDTLTERGAFFMPKYSHELKLKIIHEMHVTGRGVKAMRSKYGISHSIIQGWHKRYLLHGEEGLKNRGGTYSGEFKQSVLKYMEQNHLSMTETAAHFNISAVSSLSKWRDQMEQEGASRLYVDKRGKHLKMVAQKKRKSKQHKPDSIEALREENEQLRLENEYLKKLNALVQERMDQEAKKKSKS
jgi:transposase